mgnify:CR=1 FL=1
MYLFIGNARKKDKYKRMKQQEAKKELKKKGIGGGGKAGGKVTPFTGTDQTVGKQQLGTIMNSSWDAFYLLFFLSFLFQMLYLQQNKVDNKWALLQVLEVKTIWKMSFNGKSLSDDIGTLKKLLKIY